MPYVGPLQLTVEEEKQLTELVKYATHWRVGQRAQTILWLSQGKKVAEIAELQSRIPETIRLQRRLWRKLKFDAIKEGYRSGRTSLLKEIHHEQILLWIHAEQIRQRLHEQFQLMINVQTIKSFLKRSGIVYKRTRHSLKKKMF